VVGVSTQSQRGEAKMGFTVEVGTAADIPRVSALLREVKGVIAVRRR
jgi:GTP pyrophosphokinase